VHIKKLRKVFASTIEREESAFCGYRKGTRGWGAKGKELVMGIVKRNGQFNAFPNPERSATEVISLVRTYTTPAPPYYTDT